MDPVYIQWPEPGPKATTIGGEYDENYDTPKNKAFKKNYEELVKKE